MEDGHLWIALCVLMNAAISQASQDISTHTGENLTIPCPIQVDSGLRILYWRKNGKTIYFSGENSNGNYSVTDTTSLVISDVSNRDAGNYSCKLIYQSLDVEESDVINVYVTDLTVSHCSSSQQGTVDDCSCHVDGTNLTSLVCTASGFPYSPAIQWTHNGQTVGFSSTDLKQFQDNVTLICNAWDRNVATVSAEKTVCIFYKNDVRPSQPAKPAIPRYAIALIIVLLLALITFIIVLLVRYKRKKGHLPIRCPFTSCSDFSKVDKSPAQIEDGNKAAMEELLPGNSHENKVDKSQAQNGEDGNKATTEELLPGNSHQNKFDKSHAQNGEDGNKATTEEVLPGNSHQNKSPATNPPDGLPHQQIEEETADETDGEACDLFRKNLIRNESTGNNMREELVFQEVHEGMKKDEDDNVIDIPEDNNSDVKAWKEAEKTSPPVEHDPEDDDVPLVGRVLLDDLHASNEQSRVAIKRAINWLMKKRVKPYKDLKLQSRTNVSLQASVHSLNQSMQGSIIKDSSGDRDVAYVTWILKQLDRIRDPTDRDECEILITKPDFQEMTDESQIPEYTGKIINVSIGGYPAMSSTLNRSIPERNELSGVILAELQTKSPQERTATRNAISQIILEFIRKGQGHNSMIDSTEGFVHSNSPLPSYEDLLDKDSRLVALWTSKIVKLEYDIEYSITDYLFTPKSSIPSESSAGLKEEGSNETLKSPSLENLLKDSNERVQIG